MCKNVEGKVFSELRFYWGNKKKACKSHLVGSDVLLKGMIKRVRNADQQKYGRIDGFPIILADAQ